MALALQVPEFAIVKDQTSVAGKCRNQALLVVPPWASGSRHLGSALPVDFLILRPDPLAANVDPHTRVGAEMVEPMSDVGGVYYREVGLHAGFQRS